MDGEPLSDPARPGRYRLHLDDTWKVLYAFGGATMGLGVRAMDRHVGDPAKRPVAVRAVFLTPLEPGDLVVDVDTLRSSRSVDHLEASVRQCDSSPASLRLSGTWGGRSPDPVTGVGLECPHVPGPEEGEPIEHHPAFAQFPVHAHFDERRCPGWSAAGAFFDGPSTAESAVWARLADGHASPDGGYDPAALVVLADRAPGPHLGPTFADSTEGRPVVSLDLTIRFFAEPRTEWLLLHSKIVQAADRYITTRVVLWDQAATLVAVADQTSRLASRAVRPPEDGLQTT